MKRTENLNIIELRELPSPRQLTTELPITEAIADSVSASREALQRIIRREDPRLAIVLGPCSLHDEESSLDYANRLRGLAEEVSGQLLLVMRTYFEKPRTRLGWKGLLYDPGLDESDNIQEGFRLARKLLLEITGLGLPVATEILDPIVPQYLCDLVSWVSIGARTAESQIHRQMASGLSMPIGFKNSTDGNLAICVDAIRSASAPHAFLGINDEGHASICTTRGNAYGHVVLRGGATGANYQSEYVAFAQVLLRKAGIQNGIFIDCSHGNSRKDPNRQKVVAEDVLEQIAQGDTCIFGMMMESFIHEGSQPIPKNLSELQYGVSITDACMSWEQTQDLVRHVADSLR